MIQGDFHRMIGAKTIGFSGGQFCFVVEALDNGTGKPSFGTKPVQQQGPMTVLPDNSYCLIFLTFFRSDVSLSSSAVVAAEEDPEP